MKLMPLHDSLPKKKVINVIRYGSTLFNYNQSEIN